MGWYQTKKASKLLSLDKRKILVIDTETTGYMLHRDEIIQLSIIDGYGTVLYSSYIKPKHRKNWKRAEETNHINYEMVKDYPFIEDEKDKIQELFNNAQLIVGYNVNFDINFITKEGIVVLGDIFDVMNEFAHYIADNKAQRYRNYKLIECAEYYGYSFTPHDAENDAEATLYCFDQLINDPVFTINKAKQKREYKKQARENSISNDSSYEAIKIEISFQPRTKRRLPLIIKGILLLVIGELLYYFNTLSLIMSYTSFVSELTRHIQYRPVDYIMMSSLLLVGIGSVTIIIGMIKTLIGMPRLLFVVFKRLVNRFK